MQLKNYLLYKNACFVPWSPRLFNAFYILKPWYSMHMYLSQMTFKDVFTVSMCGGVSMYTLVQVTSEAGGIGASAARVTEFVSCLK